MRLSAAVACLVVAVACSACQNGQSAAQVAALEQRIAIIEGNQKALTETTGNLATGLQTLDETVIKQMPDRGATFQPDSKGFQAVHTDFGVFLVRLVDVKPYANGYKAVIELGNPLAVDFEDVKLDVRWGPAAPKEYTKEYTLSTWLKQFKSSTQTISKRVMSGSWNPVELILTPATAETIGQIEITSISTTRVFLQNR